MPLDIAPPHKFVCERDLIALVGSANELSCEKLLRNSFGNVTFLTLDCCCCSFTIKCLRSSELTFVMQEKIFSITKENMKNLYMQSSWGWDEGAKRRELFAPESRFLICSLVNVKASCEADHHESPRHLKSNIDDLCAFIHFRFEVDEHRPVLYCYEIQLKEGVRGLRLGHRLLQILYKIAADNQMTWVLLTVFKLNTLAYNFFIKNGFGTDITDPSEHGKLVDYAIISRRL